MTTCRHQCSRLLPEFSPVNVMADFEDASMLALKAVYGKNVEAEGCWFHFARLLLLVRFFGDTV